MQIIFTGAKKTLELVENNIFKTQKKSSPSLLPGAERTRLFFKMYGQYGV